MYKENNSNILTYQLKNNNMKFLNLIVLIFLMKGLSSQTNLSDSLNIQLSNVTVTQDTVTGLVKYKLAFKLSIQQLQNLKYIDIAILNQSDAFVLQIGVYDLKIHQSGFYYLETPTSEKKTILGNDVFFTTTIDQSVYNNSWKVKLNYTSNINILKSVINPIAH